MQFLRDTLVVVISICAPLSMILCVLASIYFGVWNGVLLFGLVLAASAFIGCVIGEMVRMVSKQRHTEPLMGPGSSIGDAEGRPNSIT